MIVKFTKWMYESGNTPKWFSWIEGLTLSAAFIAVGWQSGYWPVTVLGLFSALLSWSYAVYVSVNICGDFVVNSLPKWLGWPVAVIVSLTLPAVILVLLILSIMALIENA